MIGFIHVTDRPLIVGSGVAGLSVALGLPRALVVTKTEIGGGSSEWAQGGVASAVGPDDDPGQHAVDTVGVAAGLADAAMVKVLTEGGPGWINKLVSLGAEFDRTPDGELALGREAGHGRRRIIHADGDATGAEVMRTLVGAVRLRRGIDVLEDTHVVDLVRARGRIVGVLAIHDGEPIVMLAPAVVLATGGIGQLYSRTTNPVEVTGDGIAMAARAGARLIDMEFVQFHPTALDVGLDPMPLLTEALRGEGATLVDAQGVRYMPSVHPDAELAPRDVVARANYRHRGDAFLDARLIGPAFPDRFPTVFASAMAAGFDPRDSVLPVSPAAHYYMGGIWVGEHGATSLPGLFAVGECSSTGVHGANRLASNSLLEGLVFGGKVADAIFSAQTAPSPLDLDVPAGAFAVTLERPAEIEFIRAALWEGVGVERSEAGLTDALDTLDSLAGRVATSLMGRNAVTVGRIMVRSALEREESRGGHFRTDYPHSDPDQA
ncbi:MAG: L-aspartate oxidase, partial [Acidimicrobiia bacterium]|nr:L-aspartate oxidase [Acidimicrobiia bacterium]